MLSPGDLTVTLRSVLKPRYLLLFLKSLYTSAAAFLQAVFCRHLGLLHKFSHSPPHPTPAPPASPTSPPPAPLQGAIWRHVFYSLWVVANGPEQDLHTFAQGSHYDAQGLSLSRVSEWIWVIHPLRGRDIGPSHHKGAIPFLHFPAS